MLAIDGEGTMSPVVVLVLPLGRAPLWMIICFFGSINAKEEAFKGRIWVWVGWEEDLQCTKDLNESTGLW